MIDNEFIGKVVLITGGTRGIGKAVLEAFAKLGADVAFTYNSSKEACETIENQNKNAVGKVKGYQLNLGNVDNITAISKKIIEEFGKIDILVNNAGMIKDGYLSILRKESITSVIEANLIGTMILTQNIIGGMMKRQNGSVINISSISGVYGNAGQCNYAASKMGLIGFTNSLALEVAQRNVRVNAISPGFIKTDMLNSVADGVKNDFIKHIPMRRLGEPEEIANVVVFLASNMSSYITGQNIIVDGGV